MRKFKAILPFLILFALWATTRFYKLKSGLHLLEPDEWEYLQIAHSFKNSWIPLWHDRPYFLQLPLFPLLAHWFDFRWVSSWWGHFGPVRIISVLSSGLYSFWVYKISRHFFSRQVALWTTAIWLITPLFWFYSRQGTPDFLALAFSWAGVYWFLQATQKQNVRLSILSGFCFALGVLAKTNAVIFLSLPVIWFFLDNKKPYLAKFTLLSSGLIIGLIITSLAVIFKTSFFPSFSTHPRLFFVTHPRANLVLLWEYFKIFPWWLSWPVVGMVGMGLIRLINEIRKTTGNSKSPGIATSLRWPSGTLAMTILALGIGQIFLLGWWYFSPRNGLLAASGGFLLIAVAINWLFKKFSVPLVSISLGLLFILTFVTGGLTALSATQHHTAETTLSWIENNNPNNLPVYTTFDAEKLTEIGGYQVQWLTPNFTSPALIITDHEKTNRISSLSFETFIKAKQAIDEIKPNNQPVKIFADPQSLFPVTRQLNTLSIYEIDH